MNEAQGEYRQINNDELRRLLQLVAPGDIQAGNDFFAHFGYYQYLQNQDYRLLFISIVELLGKLRFLHPKAYRSIHKGTPFYWAALAAFLIFDYQSAAYFFDAATAEDLKNAPGQLTPSLLFMTLDSQNPNQAARDLTLVAEGRLAEYVNRYNAAQGSIQLSVEQIRNTFLRPAVENHPEWRTLVTAWISYLLETGHRLTILNIRVEKGSWEPFYIHLFKGCLLFESLLKANPTIRLNSNDSLGRILNKKEIKSRFGISKHVRLVATLEDILDGIDNNENPAIENSVEMTGKIRNTTGHYLGWGIELKIEKYERLTTMVALSCLHALSALYSEITKNEH